MTVDYQLSNARTGAELTKGTETSFSGYDVVASPYATLVAQQDAQKFGAREIADRIRIDLGVYFSKQRTS
jgi:LPS-assembly lipoprotein